MARSKPPSSTSDETSCTHELTTHMDGNKCISSDTSAVVGDKKSMSGERIPVVDTHTPAGHSDRLRGVKRKLPAAAEHERQTRQRGDDEQDAATNDTPPLVSSSNSKNDEAKNVDTNNNTKSKSSTTPPIIAEDDSNSSTTIAAMAKSSNRPINTNSKDSTATTTAATTAATSKNPLVEKILHQRRVLLHRTRLCRAVVRNRIEQLEQNRLNSNSKTTSAASPTTMTKNPTAAPNQSTNNTATTTPPPLTLKSAAAEEEHQQFLQVTRQALLFAVQSKKGNSSSSGNSGSHKTSSNNDKKISRASSRRSSSGVSRKYSAAEFVTEPLHAGSSSSGGGGSSSSTVTTSAAVVIGGVAATNGVATNNDASNGNANANAALHTSSNQSSDAAAAVRALPDTGKSLHHHSHNNAHQKQQQHKRSPVNSAGTGTKLNGNGSSSSSSSTIDARSSHKHKQNARVVAPCCQAQYTSNFVQVCQAHTSLMQQYKQKHNQNVNVNDRAIRTQMLPARRTTHWDVLLQEMRHVAMDYHQERIWKYATAKVLAQDVVVSHKAIFMSKRNGADGGNEVDDQRQQQKQKEVAEDGRSACRKIASMVQTYWDVIFQQQQQQQNSSDTTTAPYALDSAIETKIETKTSLKESATTVETIDVKTPAHLTDSKVQELCELDQDVQNKINKSRKAEVTKYTKLYTQCGFYEELKNPRILQITRGMDILFDKSAPSNIGTLHNPTNSLYSILALIWRYHSLGPVLLIGCSYSMPLWRCLHGSHDVQQDIRMRGISFTKIDATITNGSGDEKSGGLKYRYKAGDVLLVESHTLDSPAVQQVLQRVRFAMFVLDARLYPTTSPVTTKSIFNNTDVENGNTTIITKEELTLPREYHTDAFWKTALYSIRYLLPDDDLDTGSVSESLNEKDKKLEVKEELGRVQRIMLVEDSIKYAFGSIEDVCTEWCLPGYYPSCQQVAKQEDDDAMEIDVKEQVDEDSKETKDSIYFLYPTLIHDQSSTALSSVWSIIALPLLPRQREVYTRICTWVRGSLATKHITSTSISSALLRLRRVCFTCDTVMSAISGSTVGSIKGGVDGLEKVLSGSTKLFAVLRYLIAWKMYSPTEDIQPVLNQLKHLSPNEESNDEDGNGIHSVILLATNTSTLHYLHNFLTLLNVKHTTLLPTTGGNNTEEVHALDYAMHQRILFEYFQEIMNVKDDKSVSRVLLCTPYHLDPALHGVQIPSISGTPHHMHLMSLEEDWSGRGDAVFTRLSTYYGHLTDEEEEECLRITCAKLVCADTCESTLVYSTSSDEVVAADGGIGSRILAQVNIPLQDVLQCKLTPLPHSTGSTHPQEVALFLPTYAKMLPDSVDDKLSEHILHLQSTILYTEHTHCSNPFLYPKPRLQFHKSSIGLTKHSQFPQGISTIANPNHLRVHLVYATQLVRYLQMIDHQQQLEDASSGIDVAQDVTPASNVISTAGCTYEGSVWDLLVYNSASTKEQVSQAAGAVYTEPIMYRGVLQTHSPMVDSEHGAIKKVSKTENQGGNQGQGSTNSIPAPPILRLHHIPHITSRERYYDAYNSPSTTLSNELCLNALLHFPASTKTCVTSTTPPSKLLHELHRVHLIRQHSDLVWAAVLQRIHTSLNTPSVPLSSSGNSECGITLPMGVRVRHVESTEGAAALVAWWRRWDERLINLVRRFTINSRYSNDSSSLLPSSLLDRVNWNLVSSALGDDRVSARQCRMRYRVLMNAGTPKSKQQQHRKRSLSETEESSTPIVTTTEQKPAVTSPSASSTTIAQVTLEANSSAPSLSKIQQQQQETKRRLLHLRQSSSLAHPAPTIPHTTTLLTTAHNSHETSVQTAVHAYLSDSDAAANNSKNSAITTDAERVKAMQGEMWPLQLLDLADRRRAA